VTDRITYYKFVRHSEWPAWTRLGWCFDCDLGLPHGLYSALFVWRGVGEPVVPGRERVALAGGAE
jgi:hypothetical protein